MACSLAVGEVGGDAGSDARSNGCIRGKPVAAFDTEGTSAGVEWGDVNGDVNGESKSEPSSLKPDSDAMYRSFDKLSVRAADPDDAADNDDRRSSMD